MAEEARVRPSAADICFDHCVSTTVEVAAATIDGGVSTGHCFAWLAAVTLGNVVGGVAIVGLLNYGQVRAGD
jgi:formate/nitrite transporter FocA (FNT family)